jgi:5-methyltetrahydropteroyltriglutamate--homocysteine methyltransferase
MSTAHTKKLFFRADHVGSLLRPQSILDARKRKDVPPDRLRATEDAAIRAVVTKQEEVGLPVVTDGELRRENWYADFIGRLGGVEISAAGNPSFKDDPNHESGYIPKTVKTIGKITHGESLLVRDFTYLASIATAVPKITIPSPTRLHFHGGRAAVSNAAYPDIEAFFADAAAAWQAEIAALEAAGCRYIQVDDPILSYFIPDRLRAEITANGEKPEERLARYLRLVNACISKRAAATTIGFHVCRGNARSAWLAEGGYERIAEQVFSSLDVDHFLLEYDDARSGDFTPLRFVPKGKRVVLGLVTTKTGTMEKKSDLHRRIDEATKYVPLDDLAVSPQCGFASIVEGNIISEEEQWAKLRLVVELARDVWEPLAADQFFETVPVPATE